MINLIQPISFFDRLAEQDGYKENSPRLHKFLADERLIPFQIKVSDETTSITSLRMVGFKYQFDIDLINGNEDALKIVEVPSGKYVLFFGGEDLVFNRLTNYPDQPPIYDQEPLSMCPDYYHYEVTLNTGKTYYSEKFYVNGSGLCDSPITLEIQAWNDRDKQGFTFTEGFKFKAYFNTFIHSQQATITNEYLKDGYERQILQRRVIQFPFKFEIDPVPFSIANGLAVLTAFDNFVIIENGNEYLAENVEFEAEEIEGTSFNQVVFTFTIKGQDVIKTFC